VVSERPHDAAAHPVRLGGETVDEVENRLQVPPVSDVSGEHKRAIPGRPVSERVDEAERPEDLVQRLQLAVNIAHHANALRAVPKQLRHVSVRHQAALDRHVLDDDVFNLEHVQLVRR
jgi:hypothetical protein